jgi:hypothetical protein
MKNFFKKYLLIILSLVTIVIFIASTVKFSYNSNYQKEYIIETNYKFSQIVELCDAISEKLGTSKENISVSNSVQLMVTGDEMGYFILTMYDSKEIFSLHKEINYQSTFRWVINDITKKMPEGNGLRLTLADLSNILSKIQIKESLLSEYIFIESKTLVNPPLFSGRSYLFSNFEYVELDAPLIGKYICINHFVNYNQDRSYSEQIKYYFEVV